MSQLLDDLDIKNYKSNNATLESSLSGNTCRANLVTVNIEPLLIMVVVGLLTKRLLYPGERMYDESIFQNRVARYRVDDHNVPKLR